MANRKYNVLSRNFAMFLGVLCTAIGVRRHSLHNTGIDLDSSRNSTDLLPFDIVLAISNRLSLFICMFLLGANTLDCNSLVADQDCTNTVPMSSKFTYTRPLVRQLDTNQFTCCMPLGSMFIDDQIRTTIKKRQIIQYCINYARYYSRSVNMEMTSIKLNLTCGERVFATTKHRVQLKKNKGY